MSKAAPFLSSSNSGEFSPRMDARVDFDKYASAISRGLNLVCLPHGGVTARPGTRYVAEIKDSDARSRLIEFEPVSGQSYIIEAGEEYFRFYRNQGQLQDGASPLEVSTPYSATDVLTLRWTQSADVLYLFHDDHPPYKLSRLSDASWTMTQVFFDDGPWLEINPDTDLSATNLIRNGRYDNGIQHWTTSTTGAAYVYYESSLRTVLFQTADPSASTATGSLKQSVTTPDPEQPHVLHFQIVGRRMLLKIGSTSGDDDIATGLYDPGWYSLEFTPGADNSPFFVEFSNNLAGSDGSGGDTFAGGIDTGGGSGGTAVPIAPGVSAAFCYTTTANLLQPSAVTGTVTLEALGAFEPFAASDVGRSVRLEYPGREPGWGIITEFTDSQTVTLQVYRDLQDTAPIESWRFGAWSDTTGWPRIGIFYQQRLFCAGSRYQPQTVWASQSSDFENMRPDSWSEGASTVVDNNALNFTIASLKVSPIVWLAGTRRLVVGTKTAQFAIASRGAALAPTDFAADPQSSVAALDAQPLAIDTVILFTQRAKRSIYELGYSQDVDAFRSADLTILSDHITRGSIAQIVYQAEPFSNIWTMLENGKLACLTYKRGQNVVGWTSIEIAGTSAGDAAVESIAVIPGDDADDGQIYSSVNRDEVWMVVRRTVNGQTKRYIEALEGYFDGPNRAHYLAREEWRDAVRAAQKDAFFVDSGLTYQGTPVTTVSGLGHLEGETVSIIADGATHPYRVVSGGAVELETAASTVHVGLPYQWIYRGMKLPFGSSTGPGIGQSKTVSGLVFVVRDAASFEYAIDLSGEGEDSAELDFQAVPTRKVSDPQNEAAPLFTGEIEHNPGGGFSTDPRVVMRSTASLPWTLLGIVPKVYESEL